jgi:hypothetical protein
MITPYRFQTPAEMREIDQELMRVATKDDPIFRMMPQRATRFPVVRWTQRDSYSGLTQARSLNGGFPPVVEVGSKTFNMQPGYYGESGTVTEEDLTLRSMELATNEPVTVEDLTAEAHMQLLHRQLNRERYIRWQVLITGKFRAFNSLGALIDLASFNPKRFVPQVPWSNLASATPLADLRVIAATYDLGVSTSFAGDAELWMNQTTVNYLLGNSNAADLGGVKVDNSDIQGMGDLNKVLNKNNLPQVNVYNQSYLDDGAIAGRWIPDGYFLLIGPRPNNDLLGEFLLTRNPSNPGASALPLVRTVAKGFKEDEEPPASVTCFRGFNGGPALYYPSCYVQGYVK